MFKQLNGLDQGIVGTYSTVLLQCMVDKGILGRVLSVEYIFHTLTKASSAWVTGQLDDAGLSTHMLALFAASLGAFTVAF